MSQTQEGEPTDRFYLDPDVAAETEQVSREAAAAGGLPISPHGPPQPGTGRVFVTYVGDLAHVTAHWECEERFVFHSGEYGEVLLWALSQPAAQHLVPPPLEHDCVEVFPLSP